MAQKLCILSYIQIASLTALIELGESGNDLR